MKTKKLAILLVVVAVLSVSGIVYALTRASASDEWEWHIIDEYDSPAGFHVIEYKNGRGDYLFYDIVNSTTERYPLIFNWVRPNKTELYVWYHPHEGGVICLNMTWTENLLNALTTSYHGVGWSGSIVRMPSLPPNFKLPPRPPECN
ncbi:MAG: hypothetical protein QW270_00165 [Candidatus Bathyarchaeia archaeon]